MSKIKTISKVLRLKDNKKKELELEIKKARDTADSEQAKLLSLEKEYRDAVNLFNRKHSEGSINANDISSFYGYFLRINGMIDVQEKKFSQRLRELASLQDTLVAAYKDKKLFEILKEKALKKEVRDKIISEQKESDFLSVSKRLR